MSVISRPGPAAGFAAPAAGFRAGAAGIGRDRSPGDEAMRRAVQRQLIGRLLLPITTACSRDRG